MWKIRFMAERMELRQGVGITAVVQAVGVSSLHAIVKAPWLLVSVLVGFAGLFLLVFPLRPSRYDATVTADGDFMPSPGSDYAGSQANDLLDRLGGIDAHHD
jgi:hypothetical protein